jgi:hypothetical protein
MYNWSQLLEFIQLQEGNEYCITIPKKTVAVKDCDFNVFWEYYHAAFVGQELSIISRSFSYTVPCLKKPSQFSFQLVIDDKYLFSVTLFFLINGLYLKTDKLLGDHYDVERQSC